MMIVFMIDSNDDIVCQPVLLGMTMMSKAANDDSSGGRVFEGHRSTVGSAEPNAGIERTTVILAILSVIIAIGLGSLRAFNSE